MSAESIDGWMAHRGVVRESFTANPKEPASSACDGSPNENGIQLMGPYEASSFITAVMTLVFFKWISPVNVYCHSLKQSGM